MEEVDQDHPKVLEVQQAVTAQGWAMTPNEAVELVLEVTAGLEKKPSTSLPTVVPGAPVQAAAPPPSPHALVREAEKLVRDLLPDRIHNLDQAKVEIPDDLYEEIAAILVDHHANQ